MRRRRIWSVVPLEGRELLSITPILGLIGPPVVSTGLGPHPGRRYQYHLRRHHRGDPPPTQRGCSAAVPCDLRGCRSEEAPRLTDQARQFYILAPGNTNQFLHGTLQMRYYTPEPGSITTLTTGTDPTTGLPTTTSFPAVNTTGTFSMSDRSTQSGGLILGDLLGSTTAEDARGRPTAFDFTVNGGGGSGGIYASSTGSGTVTITYQGNRAKVVVNASIFIYGIGEPLDTFQSNTHH